MIDGIAIRLRMWRETDLAVITEIRNDVALQAQLLARVRGSTQAQVRNWLEERTSKTDKLLFIIAKRESDTPLGFVQIMDMNFVDRCAELGICLIREAQGHGYGGESLALVCNHMHNTWNFHKLNLRVRADNAAAIRCYQRQGFESCGLLKKHVFIEGTWQDIILMERFLAIEG